MKGDCRASCCQFCAAWTCGWGLHLWDKHTHTYTHPPCNLRPKVWVALTYASDSYFGLQGSWPQLCPVYQQELPLKSSWRCPWTVNKNIRTLQKISVDNLFDPFHLLQTSLPGLFPLSWGTFLRLATPIIFRDNSPHHVQETPLTPSKLLF